MDRLYPWPFPMHNGKPIKMAETEKLAEKVREKLKRNKREKKAPATEGMPDAPF